MRDMVTSLSNRLGAGGLSLIAGALILAFLAGGVVVHRLETPTRPTANQQDQRGDHREEGDVAQGPGDQKKNSQQGEQQQGEHEDQGPGGSHASGARTNDPNETSQENG
jgi:hypothetical protein